MGNVIVNVISKYIMQLLFTMYGICVVCQVWTQEHQAVDMASRSIKRHLLCFFMFFPLLHCVLYVCICCACKRVRVKSAPTESPLSHRKHCSWNASSVVSPLILWLCDITLCHRVTYLHNLCLASSFTSKNTFCTAALLVVLLGQSCVSWPIRGD